MVISYLVQLIHSSNRQN